MKIAIINPHREGKKGAYSPFLHSYEYDYFLNVTSYIMRILNIFGVTAKRFIRSNMHDAYKYVKEYNPDISIEPHFNAIENEDINGTICLYENEKSKRLASFFLNNISNDLNTKRLYIKKLSSENRGYKNLSSFDFPSIITESFFGTSKKDCHKVTHELVGLAHVNAIMKFLKQYN